TATSDGAVLVDGFKLRMLLVSPDAAQRQFFYGVNFEFSFNTRHWDPHRYTSEIRPLIGWHLGRLDLIFNPILDNSYDGFPRLDSRPIWPDRDNSLARRQGWWSDAPRRLGRYEVSARP